MVGERFDISEVPSATLWMRTRESRRAVRSGMGVLVLADPDVPRGSPDGQGDPSATLPGARREAHAIARILDLGIRITWRRAQPPQSDS